MIQLSEHITLNEAVRSYTAIKNHLDNKPNDKQVERMIQVAVNIFEPLRSGLGDRPIRIPSFFRCNELNSLIGGATNSQHMALNGAAIDLDNDGSGTGPNNTEIFDYILNNIEFDQLIWEYGTELKPDWVHVSYNEGKNRGQVLRCDKGVYKPMYT